MTKAELIERIFRSRDLPADVTKKKVAQIVEVLFEELGAYFARAKVTKSQQPRFCYPGFGTFVKKKRAARRSVHPVTGEPITIGAAYVLDFRPAGRLREAMNGGSKKHGAARNGRGASSGGTSRRGKSGEPRGPGFGTLRSREEAEVWDDVDDAALAEALGLPSAKLARVRVRSFGTATKDDGAGEGRTG